MRIIHTADWHLGKSLRGYSLLDDQYHALQEWLRLVDDVKPGAIIIAGDIYDRAVPPTDAVLLLNEVLTKVILEKKIPTLAIAGNHDSGGRLSFGGELFERAGLFLRGVFNVDDAPVILRDEFGEVAFSLFPYFEPSEIDPTLRLDADAAYAEAVAARRSKISVARSVAVAHLFAVGGEPSESERPLVVGGVGSVSPGRFVEYNYTALGHLHAPQRAGGDNIRYSGSLLKYSFDEAKQKKGVVFVELAADGAARAENLPIVAKRDVCIVEGMLDDIRRDRKRYPAVDDYVLVRLLDKTAILGAYDKLAEVYSNLCGVEFCGVTYLEDAPRETEFSQGKVSETELFADFYHEMTGEGLSEPQEKILDECVREVYRREREDEYATLGA